MLGSPGGGEIIVLKIGTNVFEVLIRFRFPTWVSPRIPQHGPGLEVIPEIVPVLCEKTFFMNKITETAFKFPKSLLCNPPIIFYFER